MQLVFQRQFNEHLLRSERRRTLILISIFLFGLSYQVINIFFSKQKDAVADPVRSFTATWLAPILIILLELWFLLYLRVRSGMKKKQIPIVVQYINVALEIGLLSTIIITVAKQHRSFNVLQSPAVFVYFLFIILSTLRLNFGLSFFCGLLASFFYFIISYFIYDHFTFTDSLKVIVLSLSGVAAGLVARQIRSGINKLLQEAEKRHKVENIFGQQISMEIAEKILKSDGKIESKRMNVAIMFIDIRNFTQFASSRSPEEIVQYQNAFFGIVVTSISKYNGIINQFLGDGCMITFGAPVAMENPGSVAVEAALEILQKIETAMGNYSLEDTRVGIGIHIGDAVTGNIGTEFRQQYSITGNVVIVASRIEQLNKQYDSQILVSEAIARSIKNPSVSAEFMDTVVLKGMHDLFRIYKVA